MRVGEVALVAALLGATQGCMGEASSDPRVRLMSVSPRKVSARGGVTLKLEGESFTPATTVEIGGAPVKVKLISSRELELTSPPMNAGPARLLATSGGGETSELKGGVEVVSMELEFVESPPYAIPLEAAVVVSSAAVRDFDGDGDDDLLLCSETMPCRLLLNDGRANFALPWVADAGPLDAGGADAGAGDAGARVDAGRADAGAAGDELVPLVVAPVEGRVLASADLDTDSDFDLLVRTRDGGTDVAANDGTGRFVSHRVLFTRPPLAVMAASSFDAGLAPDAGGAGDAGPLPVYALTAAALFDFDHDGRLDLVSAGATPDRGPFRIDLNASAHGLPSLQPLAMTLLQRDYQVNALAVGDLDADGRPDVALSTVGAADGISLRVFFSRPGGWQEMPGGLPGLGPYSGLQLGDVDGDGSLDVVAVGAGQDRLLINDGSGHFFDASVLALPLDAASGTALLLVDLDRDSDLDLVTGNSAATMRLYVNDGHGKFNDRTPVLPRRIETVGWLGAANVDGDADTDVVLLAGGAAAVRIYLSVEP